MPIVETELTAEVAANLEIDSTAAADLTRFNVYENLNAAQRDIINALDESYFLDMIENLAVNLVINQENYALTTTVRVLDIYLDYVTTISESNPGRLATEYKQKNFIKPMASVASKNFPMYDLSGTDTDILLGPTPDANVTGGMDLRHIKTPATIASATNSDLNERFKSLVIYRATELSAMVDNYRPQISDKFGKMYMEELAKFIPRKE